MLKSLIFAFLAISPCFVLSMPTCEEIQEMKAAITEIIFDNEMLMPKAVRLGFHDCVGGCNGCVNHNNPDNFGLLMITEPLDQIYEKLGFSQIVSRADFYALAAVVGVELGLDKADPIKCPKVCFNLKWGRVDREDCSNDQNIFPDPKKDSSSTYKYFENEFGMSIPEVVALMGAHTLGQAAREHSGYLGDWVQNEDLVFDEKFYSIMVNKKISWINVNKEDDDEKTAKWQFDGVYKGTGEKAGFMLNTDFEMFYNLSLSENGQITCNLDHTCGLDDSCQPDNCQKGRGFDLASKYANDCAFWLVDFKNVFEKMLSHTVPAMELESSNCGCETFRVSRIPLTAN